MTLYEKILQIYPQLTLSDFMDNIRLQDDGDGKGAYIAHWAHPVYKKPDAEDLAE